MKKIMITVALLTVLLAACANSGQNGSQDSVTQEYEAPAYYANMYSGNLHTTYNDVVWDMVYQEDTGYAMQMNGNTILDHVKDYFITDGYLYYTTIQEDGTYKYTLSDGSTSKIADISCTELVCVDEDIYFTESDRHTVGKLYHTTVNGETPDVLLEDSIVAPFNLYPIGDALYFCMAANADGAPDPIPTVVSGESGFGGTGYDFGDIYCLNLSSQQYSAVVSEAAVRRFLIENQILYYVNGTNLCAYDLLKGEPVELSNAPYDVLPETFTISNGDILYSGMLDGVTHRYDLQTGESSVIAQQIFNRGIYIAGDLVYGDDDVLVF